MSASNSTNFKYSHSTNDTDLYIYHIPVQERKMLCAILDEMDQWKKLAEHMGYTKFDLQSINKVIARGESPSDELLTMWGQQNHTASELFVLLHRMRQYEAMEVLKAFANAKLHHLIMKSQPDLSNLLKRDGKSEKVLNHLPNSSESNINNESYTGASVSTSSVNSKEDNDNYSQSISLKNIEKYARKMLFIPYKELVDATKYWSDQQMLGRGGFGAVYKGKWKHTDVAIKRIIGNTKKVQLQQSLTELKYLNSFRHDNILPLYGFSIDGEEPLLVYQLMSGGSLDHRLNARNGTQLEWTQRLNIARGVARGLQYLHTCSEKPLIHGDIKPGNILLDQCGVPKIGDFGLAREGPNLLNESVEVSTAFGTRAYLPREYVGFKSLSTKVDTFSYGVVLFELATGLRAHDKNRKQEYLYKHILALAAENPTIDTFIDKNCPYDPFGNQICDGLIKLGRICTAETPNQRPEMEDVLMHLEPE